jgi:hypothetical protein
MNPAIRAEIKISIVKNGTLWATAVTDPISAT